MENINYGIDLGTTNSGIGRYEHGKVHILRNPVGHREILPSVVSFYKGRVLVGDKAREQYLSNAGQVFSAFKRRIGTSDTYPLTLSGQQVEKSPVDLSAYILNELKNYVREPGFDSVVITIPASFDTIQSNATKKSGYQAGFKEVVLLQEPVAACLAYANTNHLNLDAEQRWLVYDFGGGTFDSALVYINKSKLKVLDNKGNNFLGGIDIDYAFISELIVPKISETLADDQLWDNLIDKKGIYHQLWHYLMYQAEEAKKQLSVMPSTWIEIDFPDLNLFTEFEVTQADFNAVVKPKYLESEDFVLDLLTQNGLSFSDIDRIILVGDTTYIPFIKDALARASGIIVDDSIDPTTAVIVGATYYAGSQSKTVKPELDQKVIAKHRALVPDVKLSFESYSHDDEELLAFKTSDPFRGYYRVTRSDGGFDTGLIAFENTGSEFISLRPKNKNTFKLDIFDEHQNKVWNTNEIVISQGLYSVSGQLLPQDICIELDSKDDNTYLEVIFKRNSLLPLSKTLYKTFSRSILMNSDDKITINVVEGKGGTLPGANLSIGYIELSGRQIDSELIQGTDIEIQIDLDESRGLNVEIFVPTTGQQINESFHIARREVHVHRLIQDLDWAIPTIQKEIEISNKVEAYELSARFQEIANKMENLKRALAAVMADQVTEEKYRLDEQKRKLLSELDGLTRARDVFAETQRYREQVKRFTEQEQYAYDEQKRSVAVIIAKEKEFLESGDKHLIGRITDELTAINDKIYLQNDESYVQLFLQLSILPSNYYKEELDVEKLIDTGREAVRGRDYIQLKQTIMLLFGHLKDEFKSKREKHIQGSGSNFKTGLK